MFIICKELYGLKSAQVVWRALFVESIMVMGFKSTEADPNINPCTDKSQWFLIIMTCCLFLLILYCVCLMCLPKLIMDKVGKLFRVKEEWLGEPNCYSTPTE